jgi:hypothetical protein
MIILYTYFYIYNFIYYNILNNLEETNQEKHSD